MKYFYCDTCSLITWFQVNILGSLSQYKDQFYISKTQVIGELIRPEDLTSVVMKTISIIEKDREEIVKKTLEFVNLHKALSYYDCLSLAYAVLDGYCLITDDKELIKKCKLYGVETKTAKMIKKEFKLGGDDK